MVAAAIFLLVISVCDVFVISSALGSRKIKIFLAYVFLFCFVWHYFVFLGANFKPQTLSSSWRWWWWWCWWKNQNIFLRSCPCLTSLHPSLIEKRTLKFISTNNDYNDAAAVVVDDDDRFMLFNLEWPVLSLSLKWKNKC